MTKEENIFFLYDKLEKNGSRGKALNFISQVFETSKRTIKNHWFGDRELPIYITRPNDKDKERVDSQLDQVITYLQNANKS